MRPLRYSINVTLDGCCDHRVGIVDEDLHRHAAENLAQADALLFWPGDLRDDGGRVAAAGADGSEAGLDGTLRPDDRRGKEVRSCRAPWSGWIGTRSWCAGIWGRSWSSSSGSRVRAVRGRREAPAGAGGAGIDR